MLNILHELCINCLCLHCVLLHMNVGECAGGCGGGRRREMGEGVLQEEISITSQMAW